MPDFVVDFLKFVGVGTPTERSLVYGLAIAWIVVTLIRVVLSAFYKGQLALVRSAAKKDITDPADSDKSKSPLFKRAAKDYAQLGERGLARIDSEALVRKSALRFRLLFWNLSSVEKFLDTIEPGLFLSGALLTAIAESKAPFAAAALIVFAGGKVLAASFDYKTSRDELYSETAFLLDKELGKLYVTDAASSINLLRTELRNTLTYQSKYLGEAINELRDKLAYVSERTLGDTAKAVESTLTSVSASAETVAKPLEEWRLAIVESRKSHEDLNLSIVRMSGAADGFRERMKELEQLIDGYRTEFLNNNKNVEKELARLNDIADAVTSACARAEAQTKAVESATEFVKSNQQMLANSMQQYEQALKDITSQVGGGLGKIIEYHAQSSYRTLADGAADSLRQIGAANNELIGKLQSVLDRILEQSRNETALILNLKEQMELELDTLKRSVASGQNGQ